MILDFEGKRPRVGADCFIAETAAVIGDVALGDECSVWFGAVLRGDIEPVRIGARTNVQDGTVVHTRRGFPAEVGEEVTVGHRAVLHGCRVGDGSLIGIGAILLDGCVIGEECLVGAGALVKEGAEFPSGVLILGTPARAVRQLSPEERRALRDAARRYVQRAQKYRTERTPAENSE